MAKSRFRARASEQLLDFPVQVFGIERAERGPVAHRRQRDDQELQRVLSKDSHPVVGPETQVVEQPAELSGHVQHLPVGDRTSLLDAPEHDLVWVFRAA